MLIGLRRIKGSHSGENIAETVLPVLKSFELDLNLGIFVADNAGSNDTAIRAILQDLNRDIKDPDGRRARCFAYIINLVTRQTVQGADQPTGPTLSASSPLNTKTVPRDTLLEGTS